MSLWYLVPSVSWSVSAIKLESRAWIYQWLAHGFSSTLLAQWWLWGIHLMSVWSSWDVWFCSLVCEQVWSCTCSQITHQLYKLASIDVNLINVKKVLRVLEVVRGRPLHSASDSAHVCPVLLTPPRTWMVKQSMCSRVVGRIKLSEVASGFWEA